MEFHFIVVVFFGIFCSASALISQDSAKHTKSVTLGEFDESILPSRNVCGTIKETPKIYGGKATQLGELPWTVALQYKSASSDNNEDADFSTLCAGSLINKRQILTSANCVTSKFKIPANVILGEWKLSSNPDCINNECAAPIQKIKIKSFIAHPDYKPNGGENDIALIHLEKDVEYTEFVSPICLPPKNLPFPQEGETVTVAGWGKTEADKVSDVLLRVDLPIASSKECSEKLKRAISENRFCAGGEEGKDSCLGDSGSPAIRIYEDDVNQGRWYQYGIVSSGARCGIAGYAAIYTKVDYYIDWIIETIKKSNA